MFKCKLCQKEFTTNQNLIRHSTLRKKPCNKEIIFKCDNCLKIFSTKANLTRHLNRKNPCKQIINKDQTTQIQNITNNNNTTNNTIINYNLIIQNEEVAQKIFEQIGKSTYQIVSSKNKGNTRILQLSDRSSTSIFDQAPAIFDLIERMFFNIDKPENWILLKDEVENKFKIKLEESSFKDFNVNIYKIIYVLFKDILKYADKNKNDPNVIKFYKNYITRYDDNYFIDVNSITIKDNMNKFIQYINGRMETRYENFIQNIEKLLLRENDDELNWLDTHIDIIPLGNEDLTIFNREELIKNIDYTNKYQFLLSFIKFIHNNNSFPEYQNIQYENEKIIICNKNKPKYSQWDYQINEYYLLDTIIKNIKSIRSFYQIEEITYQYFNYDEDDIPIYMNLITDYFKD